MATEFLNTESIAQPSVGGDKPVLATDFTTPTFTIATDNATLLVSARGGVVLSWRVTGPDGNEHELLDGYRNQEELDEGNGCRSAILVPWSNRIRNATYTFDGVTYDRGVDPNGIREANHGLGLEATYSLQMSEQTPEESVMMIHTHLPAVDGYPWPMDVDVRYVLYSEADNGHCLDCQVVVRNMSQTDAPVGIGWHPYVGVENLDDISVEVPARTHVITDDANIPLMGDAAFRPTSGRDHERLSLNDVALDDAWTTLVPGDDGIVRTVLSNRTGATMTLEQRITAETTGVGIVQMFTGEPLAHRPRGAVAVEPCLFMTDAFNRPECAADIRLAAGQERILDARLVWRP
ncbi:aldose 1-epimerase [Actinomyces vulturis]|uniref:aldose 1-epimerase n=1 Tax=Actinomyces vulturis TaxID=1857645 RepID=UPI000834D9B4|nr:hypothetical protein [Actinomyces vulturis]